MVNKKVNDQYALIKDWRKTEQYLLPEVKPSSAEGKYDIYPAFKLNDDQISSGFDSLAEVLSDYKIVILDCYAGVFDEHFSKKLDESLKNKGIKTSWKFTTDYLKNPETIDEMVAPFTGGDDPVFGKRTTLSLEDFFDILLLKQLRPDPEADLNLIIGPGAALSGWKGLLVYIDIPKNEIQFRARAGSITNLGAFNVSDPKKMYKRFYFVDWIALNCHKRSVLSEADLFADVQNPEHPSFISGEILRHSLSVMSHSIFRVRPWFEPGTWGGTWIRDHIAGLNTNVPNYAWSFELIVPENGLLLESSGKLLEVSFDCLMFQEAKNILGDCYKKFGTDFPIRFDFLDTFDGGNLSIQCHPRPEYIKSAVR